MHKQRSKQNYKKKKVAVPDNGEERVSKQNQRFPVVCLPDINTAPIVMKYIRFVNNGGAVGNVLSISNCLDQFMMQVSTALGICYIKAFRIRSIRILAPVQTQGTSVTLRVTPVAVDGSNNSFNTVPETYVDTSASIDMPAYVKLRPNIDTPLGSWHYSNTTNANLVAIAAPQGSTMDILFEIIYNDQSIASTYTNTLVTGTIGEMYGRNVLTNFVPIVQNIR